MVTNCKEIAQSKNNLLISKYSLSSLSNLRPAREPLSIIGWQPGFKSEIFANEPALLKLNGNNSELTRLWAIQRNPPSPLAVGQLQRTTFLGPAATYGLAVA
jgi:hypothetical protein